jgi:hypothetical protein
MSDRKKTMGMNRNRNDESWRLKRNEKKVEKMMKEMKR